MTTALIADDEPHLRVYLQAKLGLLWPDLEIVALTRNGNETAETINRLAPDIVFLDIKMPGMTGLEVAQGIRTNTRVVFVTAFDEFAVQAFEREAIDYLLKPVTDERLAKTIDRLQRSLSETGHTGVTGEIARMEAVLALFKRQQGGAAAKVYLRWIRANRGQTTYQVPVTDVIYFRAVDKYTTVVTQEGEHLIRTALVDLLTELDGEIFWQIHRSTVVNVNYIASTRRDDRGHMFVALKCPSDELVVSRAYMHLFKHM